MAIDFNGTTDRVDYANIYNPVGGPFTFSTWVYPDTVSDYNVLFAAHRSGDAATGIIFFGDVASARPTFFVGGVASLQRTTTTGWASGSWQHLLVTWDGSTTAANIHIYLNGAELSYAMTKNGASLYAASGSWSVGGEIYRDTVNLDGRLAEPGAWNRIPTAGEIAALAKGFAPQCFPYGLKFAPRLVRGCNDPVSGNVATLDGTTVADHPRIIYPGSLWVPGYTPAAPPAGQPFVKRFFNIPFCYGYQGRVA